MVHVFMGVVLEGRLYNERHRNSMLVNAAGKFAYIDQHSVMRFKYLPSSIYSFHFPPILYALCMRLVILVFTIHPVHSQQTAQKGG